MAHVEAKHHIRV